MPAGWGSLAVMTDRPLWAPWRIEYIQGPKGDQCIFCDPDPAHVIERGEKCFTILNTYPYAPGHVMLAPFRHVGTLDELAEDEMLELMGLARRTVAAQRTAMTPDGFNVGINLGKVAGAGIADHLHVHVVPRWEGDNNFMPVTGDIRVISQALDATREVLLEALRGQS
jgi:ATP adenylyltransferase